MIREYPDGKIEVRASGSKLPPDVPTSSHAANTTVWARRDDGPWLLVEGERSVYAALTRIDKAEDACEAIARLCPPTRPQGGLTMNVDAIRSLHAAIDAMKAHDAGAWDSGIADEALKDAVVLHLNALSSDDRRRTLAECARSYLTDEAIRAGYGLQDVISLVRWLEMLGVEVEG